MPFILLDFVIDNSWCDFILELLPKPFGYPLWKILNILTSKSVENLYEKTQIWVIDVKISEFCLKISRKFFARINDPNSDRIRIAISTRDINVMQGF